MKVRSRITTIRLMEKIQANPAWAKALGIESCVVRLREAADMKEK